MSEKPQSQVIFVVPKYLLQYLGQNSNTRACVFGVNCSIKLGQVGRISF